MEENLRGHCVGSAALFAQYSQLRADRFCKTKIRDLDGVIFEENIFELKISVNDVLFVEVIHSFDDLFKVVNFLINGDTSQRFSQIAIAEFQSNVTVFFNVPKLIQFDYEG